MPHTSLERLIALAGIYQAVHCVVRIARHGSAETSAMTPLIHGLFQVAPATTAEVFGPPGAVSDGMRQIVAQLSGQPSRNLEMTRYAILLLRLERALARRPDMLARLSEGIADARDAPLDLLDPRLLERFGALYSATLSQLSPRLLIHGDPQYLRDPAHQNAIRTLLLAGVRAARLWRQIGGSRWQLLFQGRRLLLDARRYLE